MNGYIDKTGALTDKYYDDKSNGLIQVTDEDALAYGLKASKENGLFVGISSGAAIAAAYQVAKKTGKVKK